jgi:outer membrane lipoprotein-sorting protein
MRIKGKIFAETVPMMIRISMVLGWFIGVGLSPVFCQDAEDLIRTIDEQQRGIQTVTASFSQKKETSFQKDPLLSSGLVKFKRPDRIHWTYLQPEPMEVALDGKSLWVYIPGRSQAEQYSLTRGRRMAQYVEPLTALFEKTLAELHKQYAIANEGLGDDRTYHFRLQPREEKVRKIVSRVDLWIDKSSGAILRFRMVESNGDQLSLEFKNLQINPLLTENDLRIKIPTSVKVRQQSLP